MKAIFPNSKLLQPMPVSDVHANISGNVNSTTKISPNNNESAPNILNEQNNISEKLSNAPNNLWFYISWGIIVFLIIFLIIFIYKKSNSKSS